MSETNNHSIPLVVDLDGSLLKTDLPFESFIFVMRNQPLKLIQILCRTVFIKLFTHNVISLKKQLQQQATGLSLKTMPWSKGFLNYLRQEKFSGRSLVLCTGSTEEYAYQVKNLFGLFDHAWGSTSDYNMTGNKKALFLLKKYGKSKFDYAGNSLIDLKVARFARQFILVNPSFGLKLFSFQANVYRKFNDKKIDFISLFYCLGIPFCLWNNVIFILLFYFPTLKVFFQLMFITVSFNCLAIAGCLFFNSIKAQEDRMQQNPNLKSKHNLLASGDMSFSVSWTWSMVLFLMGFGLFCYLIHSVGSIIFLIISYLFCIYLLVCLNRDWFLYQKMLYKTILYSLIAGEVIWFSLKVLV